MTTFRKIVFAISAIVILVSIFIYLHIPNAQCQSFSDQAQSFIHGRLDILPRIDSVYYNGRYYWPQGPFSSLILIPFQILFGPSFNQTVLQPFLIVLLSLVLYKLSRLKNFSIMDSFKLVYAFLFGSIVIGIITEPCYSFFAYVVSMTLLTCLLLEFEGKRRWWLLGIISAFMIATRPTASFIIFVIFYYIFHSDKKPVQKYYRLILFALPILSSILLLMWFNQTRLYNPFDTGESTNNVEAYLESLRQKGLFNLEYIPTNFFYYFLNSVQPVIRQSTRLVFPFFYL